MYSTTGKIIGGNSSCAQVIVHEVAHLSGQIEHDEQRLEGMMIDEIEHPGQLRPFAGRESCVVSLHHGSLGPFNILVQAHCLRQKNHHDALGQVLSDDAIECGPL